LRRRQLQLRPWRESDLPAARDWCDVRAASRPQLSIKRLGITLDGELRGLAEVATWRRRRLIALLLLAPEVRGWGYGSEAAGRLTAGVIRTAALAFPGNGLSLYFWLRLGYAPATEQPFGATALLMQRSVTQEGA
jgi:hypothetical protein